jgi:nucleoside recognition membrane protein YjiH
MTKKKQPVNWEKLCGQLQEALAAEMRENQALEEKMSQAIYIALKNAGVVDYLEEKLAEAMDIIDGNKPV